MKYAGMPFGMWMLFAGSFQKQLTAVLGYDADTAAMKATAALKAADRKWGVSMSEKSERRTAENESNFYSARCFAR